MAAIQPSIASYNNHNHSHNHTNSTIHTTQLFNPKQITAHTNELVVDRKILSNLANHQQTLLANPRKRSSIEPPEHIPKLWLPMDEDTSQNKRLKSLEPDTGTIKPNEYSLFKYNPWSILSSLKFPLKYTGMMTSGSLPANNINNNNNNNNINTNAAKITSQTKPVIPSSKDPLAINTSQLLMLDKNRFTKPWAPSNLRPLRDDCSTTSTSTNFKDYHTSEMSKTATNKTPIKHFLLKKSQEDSYSKLLEKSFQTKVNLLPKDTSRKISGRGNPCIVKPDEHLPRLSANLIDNKSSFSNNNNNTKTNSMLYHNTTSGVMPLRITKSSTLTGYNSHYYSKLYSTVAADTNTNRSSACNIQTISVPALNKNSAEIKSPYKRSDIPVYRLPRCIDLTTTTTPTTTTTTTITTISTNTTTNNNNNDNIGNGNTRCGPDDSKSLGQVSDDIEIITVTPSYRSSTLTCPLIAPPDTSAPSYYSLQTFKHGFNLHSLKKELEEAELQAYNKKLALRRSEELAASKNKHKTKILQAENRINEYEDANETIEKCMYILSCEIPGVRMPGEYYTPELGDDMEMRVDEALSRVPDETVLSSGFRINIKRCDMRTLGDQNWLNDEIINFYLSMIAERSQQASTSSAMPKVHNFNTFFYSKLKDSGYPGVQRWTRRIDIFSFDIILIPIHLGVHWCLSIIDLNNQSIIYYDSLLARNDKCLKLLLNYLLEEKMDKMKEKLDPSQWNLQHDEDIPIQKNSSDCGVFACQFAEFISRRVEFKFKQQHMPFIRRQMIAEILNKRLYF